MPSAVVRRHIGAIDYLLSVIVHDFSRRKECIFSNYIHISVINFLVLKKGLLKYIEIWSFTVSVLFCWRKHNVKMEHLSLHSHSLLFSVIRTQFVVLYYYYFIYWDTMDYNLMLDIEDWTGKKSLMPDVKISAIGHPVRHDFSFQSNCSTWNHLLQIKLASFLKQKMLHCK